MCGFELDVWDCLTFLTLFLAMVRASRLGVGSLTLGVGFDAKPAVALVAPSPAQWVRMRRLGYESAPSLSRICTPWVSAQAILLVTNPRGIQR